MKTDLHLGFTGNCDEAFTFYEKVFGVKRLMTMTWGEAPMPCADEDKGKVMHTAMRLGSLTLMGADSPGGRGKPFGGIDIALTPDSDAEVRRLFAELSDGGSVMMEPAPTFWSPLFSMCTDKFGVSWMIGLAGSQPA